MTNLDQDSRCTNWYQNRAHSDFKSKSLPAERKLSV